MEKKNIRFIVNPFSGVSNKDNFEELIYKHLDHAQFSYDYILTEGPGHATELGKIAVDQGYHMVVAVGGDGTINEVAAALKGSSTILGVIPGGSGNGFAMYIGIGRNLETAIKILNKGEVKAIDSCDVNGRFFLNLAGIGFDANIAYKIKQSSDRGFRLYLKTVLKEALFFKAKRFTIKMDDRTINDDYGVVVVANAAMYGYNFIIAPEAELTDGLFDLVLIKKASLFRYILSSWRFLNNSISKSKLVEIIKTKNLNIQCGEGNFYHLDGEGYKSPTDLQFNLHPKSIKVMFPVGSEIC